MGTISDNYFTVYENNTCFFYNRNSVIELVHYFRVHIDTIFNTDF